MIFGLFGHCDTFAGGIDLPGEKHHTLDSSIGPCAPLVHLRVPLAPCGGSAGEVVVAAGQRVEAGQLLCRGAVDVHAPLAGRVAGLTTVSIAGRDAMEASPALELDELADPSPLTSRSATFEWALASLDDLRERLSHGGLVVHRRPMEPLGSWVQRARRKGCRIVICNGIEGEPYATAGHRLLAEHGADVVRGLVMLSRAIEAPQMMLAVDQRRTDDYRDAAGPARMYDVERIALPHKYPVGADAILVKVLTRRETPPGGETMDVGVGVVDVATCFAASRWVACGEPCTSRAVAVAGDEIGRRGNLWVPFGVSCGELAAGCCESPIHGGPMTGLRCGPDAVTSAATDMVLGIELPGQLSSSQCIRCGWCTDHCPARLNVSALNDLFELGRIQKSRRLGVGACVECGVCSYVCPAHLPLAQRVRQIKRLTAMIGRNESARSAP